jgi:hypothetical protein
VWAKLTEESKLPQPIVEGYEDERVRRRLNDVLGRSAVGASALESTTYSGISMSPGVMKPWLTVKINEYRQRAVGGGGDRNIHLEKIVKIESRANVISPHFRIDNPQMSMNSPRFAWLQYRRHQTARNQIMNHGLAVRLTSVAVTFPS